MQTGVLNRCLDTLTAFLYCGIGQTYDDDGRKSIGVVDFDFDNDTLKPNNGTGKYARKHGGSLDEEEGNVN